MKRVVIAIAILALAATGISSATAAPKKAAAVTCKATTAKPQLNAKDVVPPTKEMSPLPTTFTIVTNCGNIVIKTVGSKAPITITQLATLAKAGFYNKTICHRLVTSGIFVLQCGDPTGSGSGGPVNPNWKAFPDENLPFFSPRTYPAGTVAMANSGPYTNGSQFFLVFGDSFGLPASYSIWGTITSGLDIVKAIAAKGTKAPLFNGPNDGTPAQTVGIEKIIVS